MAMRRNVIRLGSLAALMLGLILVIATPASASPAIPGIPDCKDAPTAPPQLWITLWATRRGSLRRPGSARAGTHCLMFSGQ